MKEYRVTGINHKRYENNLARKVTYEALATLLAATMISYKQDNINIYSNLFDEIKVTSVIISPDGSVEKERGR